MKKIRRLQTQGEGPRMLALEPQMNLTHGLTPKRLRNILELADQGDILEQHLLFADMEDRCEHLAAEMGKRKRALLTLDWEILPGRANDARAAQIAAAVREQFDAVNGFEDLLMDLADGIGHGFSACEIEWDYRHGLHLPAAFHFRPQSWFQVLREDRNQLRLRNGKPDGEELWPFGWIVHTHRSRSGWLPRCGLFRTVAWAYLIRSYALEANIRYVQVHGLPFRLGKYPPGSREEDRRALYNALRTLGQDAAGIIPQGMDILFETPASSSQDLAGALISRCELGMSKAILGGTLTSQSDGAASTNALGRVHDRVRRDLTISDAMQIASMSTCINHFCIYQVVLTVFIFLIRFVLFLFANLLLTRVFFQARLALSPHPLSQKKHAHKSPLGEVYSRSLCGSFRAGEENNGGSTPYCGRDLRNELPEITRCFLGMLAAV